MAQMLLLQSSSRRPESGGWSAVISVGQLPAQRPLAVQQPDRLAKLFVGNVRREPLREEGPELVSSRTQYSSESRSSALMRQFEDVHRPRFGHQLVHLLLAVAGRFAHHQVGHFEEGVVAEASGSRRSI